MQLFMHVDLFHNKISIMCVWVGWGRTVCWQEATRELINLSSLPRMSDVTGHSPVIISLCVLLTTCAQT